MICFCFFYFYLNYCIIQLFFKTEISRCFWQCYVTLFLVYHINLLYHETSKFFVYSFLCSLMIKILFLIGLFVKKLTSKGSFYKANTSMKWIFFSERVVSALYRFQCRAELGDKRFPSITEGILNLGDRLRLGE